MRNVGELKKLDFEAALRECLPCGGCGRRPQGIEQSNESGIILCLTKKCPADPPGVRASDVWETLRAWNDLQAERLKKWLDERAHLYADSIAAENLQ
jgi:hypothetical protein